MLVIVAGCGFRPVYRDAGPGESSTVARTLAQVDVRVIEDRAGQLLRNQLLTLLNPKGRPEIPNYHLNVRLTESKQELALQKSELATRANLRFTAAFSLYQVSGEKPLVSGVSRLTTSYNVLTADFATLAAEEDARARAAREIAVDISNRLAAHFRGAGGR